MGLFDGAADGTGSAADLAKLLALPVVLVVDCTRQSHSIAALVSGFKEFRKDVEVVGVILNRVGSVRHEEMLRAALADIAVHVFGAVERRDDLTLPSRHLGLVQAAEQEELETFLMRAANIVEESIDIDRLLGLTTGHVIGGTEVVRKIPPLGQNIAVAHDTTFAFIYPHLLDGWRKQGAQIELFSPLANEKPTSDCDAIYLPGGYPELHASMISANECFLSGLKDAASRNVFIYGECGGYMVLGEGLIDSKGVRHKMAGLLGLETSFANRKLQLGYRVIELNEDMPFGAKRSTFAAHEFHYSTVMLEKGISFVSATDARGEYLGSKGLRAGNVTGSYMHLIDCR